MEPIRVPKPPASSFNKGRRISDLIQSQIEHFQHLEQKHELQLDPMVTGDLHTEAGAARYIAHVTKTIRDRALAAKNPKPVVVSRRKVASKPKMKDEGLSLAAATETRPAPKRAKSKKVKK